MSTNPPRAKLAVSDAKVLQVIKEQAGLKYSKRAADAKAKQALEVARGMRKSIGKEGSNDTDLAAWAWHVYDRYSSSSDNDDDDTLEDMGEEAGADILIGAMTIEGAGDEASGLIALDVGRMLRTHGISPNDGDSFLRRLSAHAHNVIHVALTASNMDEIASSLVYRSESTGERDQAKRKRAEVAREAEALQSAEKEAELAEERRVRLMTAAPVQDWRKLLETDYTDVEGPTEVEEHLRHTGGIRGASLDTDREAVLEISRLLAKAGMTTAARQVKNEAKLPSASKLFDWADEAYRRSSNGTIKAGLEKWANMLVGGDEHSRERGHAFVGARSIEHGSPDDEVDTILKEAYEIARPYASENTTSSMMIDRTSRSVDNAAHEVLDFAPKRQSHARDQRIIAQGKLLNLVKRLELIEDGANAGSSDETARDEIAARSRFIEHNPQPSEEEKAIKREMETLESEKRSLFYQKRDEMHPIPPGTTGMYWYPEDVIKAVYKAIKPQEAVIDVRLRELRARKKALADETKAAKAAKKLEPKPARGPEIRRGRCHDCNTYYKWADRPHVYTERHGQAHEWVGISCPKCSGSLWRTHTAVSPLDYFVDLDATGGKTS